MAIRRRQDGDRLEKAPPAQASGAVEPVAGEEGVGSATNSSGGAGFGSALKVPPSVGAGPDTSSAAVAPSDKMPETIYSIRRPLINIVNGESGFTAWFSLT
jgi:hypothetical protein